MSRVIARNPTEAEIELAAGIAADAFPNLSLEHWRNSFTTVAEMFGLRYILVVEADGELVSSLICNPAPVLVGGTPVTHSSVGSVGTLLEHRRKGYASLMMEQTVRVLREEGIFASSLWPFSYEYYRRFGWEVGAEVRNYCADASVYAGLGDASKVRGAAPDDMPAIKSVYEICAPRCNCLTVRSDEWWQRIVDLPSRLQLASEPGRGTVVRVTEGGIGGYAVYEIVIRDGRTVVNAAEVMFTDLAYRRDMLAFFAALIPDGRIGFDAPACDIFLHELPNSRLVSTSTLPSFQFRLIDPERAMGCLRPEESVSGRLSFCVSDPVFEHGHAFGLEIEGGAVRSAEFDPGEALEMSVQTLSKLYSGYLRPAHARDLGLIKCAEGGQPLDLAERVFSTLTPYRSWLEPG